MGLVCEKGRLWVLDQTLLPNKVEWLRADSPNKMADYILELKVRGAPLIGVAAAAALARHAEEGADWEEFKASAKLLRRARPTAVNLMAAVDRMLAACRPAKRAARGDKDLAQKAAAEAERIFDEDVALCRRIAEHGARFIKDGESVLTHCNAGGLATAGIGTAVGVIRAAHESGKRIHVYVDETRPLLQGARLTAWELESLGIPYTIVCDNMAGSLMRRGKVRGVFVGADRIARNGDFANKIGTYPLAVLARHHDVPFYCAAPVTTVDLSITTGEGIPIEERSPEEVRRDWGPKRARVHNPAFDVTPADLLEAMILDVGVVKRSDLLKGALSSRLRRKPSR